MKQICNYCVMDNESDDTIVFNEKGQCNYCLDTLERKNSEYFPNGNDKIVKIFDEIKKNTINDKYNCLVGLSGGLDSSYIIYLGYKYGLRMLAVHIDDGLDTEIAKKNIEKLCKATNVDLIFIRPDEEEFKDLVLSFMKAGLDDLAMPQDNIIIKELIDINKKYNIKYSLNGANFAHESILERSSNSVVAVDKVFIQDVHNKYGTIPIKNIKLVSIIENYIIKKFLLRTKTYYPLNFVNYDLKSVIKELNDFCEYEYYGEKHHENILTRFLQCYYLPVKYKKDKRKSHYSSLIVSGQLSRSEAIDKLNTNPYLNSDNYHKDIDVLAKYFNLTKLEFESIIKTPVSNSLNFKGSFLNNFRNIARKFRKYLT